MFCHVFAPEYVFFGGGLHLLWCCVRCQCVEFLAGRCGAWLLERLSRCLHGCAVVVCVVVHVLKHVACLVLAAVLSQSVSVCLGSAPVQFIHVSTV